MSVLDTWSHIFIMTQKVARNEIDVHTVSPVM